MGNELSRSYCNDFMSEIMLAEYSDDVGGKKINGKIKDTYGGTGTGYEV